MKNQVNERVRAIKSDLRLAMNGVASQSMEEKGLRYRLNFGVELPRLKEIAQKYGRDHDLAQALWKEDIRESKILAGMIQPTDSFLPEIADIWVEQITNIEIAELTTMNLFCRLLYAPTKAFQWIAGEDEFMQTCGFLIIARLLGKGVEMNERVRDEFFDQALVAVQSGLYHPAKAAALSLKRFGTQTRENGKALTDYLAGLEMVPEAPYAVLVDYIKNEI
ncbi:MAG: DNA alkylation repair protein [Bacteroides sp.]|nr:DNA alkylation repair protein [Bacteroides sp.]